jgi:plasmid stabilization system protein ParE
LNQELVVINTYEDLLARAGFEPSLAFHPKAVRRFGSVLAPYRFLDRIPCGIESCHTPHLNGYLITTSDGHETAIGSHCGKTHFGMTFTRERQRVDQAVARRRRIESVMAMIEDMPRMIATIEVLESDYRELQEKKVRLMGAIGTGIFAVLKQRADRDNAVIEKEVAMTKAEAEAFFETSNRKANDGKGWPTKPVPVANLDGLLFIKARFKEMLVTNLIQPMRELSKTRSTDIDAMNPRHLTVTAKWIGEVPQSILKAQEIVAAGRRFFTAENIEKLTHLGASRSSMAMMIADLNNGA